jgi:hypothetical protein
MFAASAPSRKIAAEARVMTEFRCASVKCCGQEELREPPKLERIA